MESIYLVQRGKINRPMVVDRLSKAVNLDYMGSAEFEFGALPESLRTLEARSGQMVVTVEPRITDDAGSSLRVLHAFSGEEYEEYFSKLLTLRKGKTRTKESTWFDVNHPTMFKTLWCDFWWDINNHAMWSFDKNFMKNLPDVLGASWKYMNDK